MKTFKLLALGLALIMAAPAFAAKIPSTAKPGATPAVTHKAAKSCASKKLSKNKAKTSLQRNQELQQSNGSSMTEQ